MPESAKYCLVRPDQAGKSEGFPRSPRKHAEPRNENGQPRAVGRYGLVEVARIFAPSMALTLATKSLGPLALRASVQNRSRRSLSQFRRERNWTRFSAPEGCAPGMARIKLATRVRFPHLPNKQKKPPRGWLLFAWWRWRESNSRPQALRLWFYMRSLSSI